MWDRTLVAVLILLSSSPLWGQGQDSQPFERDLQVIVTMISGGFDNSNQAYFDYRAGREPSHRRVHVDVRRMQAPEIGEHVFVATQYWDDNKDGGVTNQLWTFAADSKSESVRMRAYVLNDAVDAESEVSSATIADTVSCDLFWRRKAAQFQASSNNCGGSFPKTMTLSQKQLWMEQGDGVLSDYQMHRVRNFECYADIPGVGGGVDEPYERYDGFRLHDQGGAVSFDTIDGRSLGISLLLVDWPINNYEGVFSRDSFVVYVTEMVEGKQKEHGYAFTVPEADRIGINLKWMLVNCFMTSNKVVTPYM